MRRPTVPADTLQLPSSESQEDPSTTYRLRHDRCAAELVIRMHRIPVVLIRLRIIAADLRLTEPGCAASAATPSEPAGGLLSAQIAATPLFTSIPFTRRWAMRSIPRAEPLTLTATLPTARVQPKPGPVDATVTAADRRWPLRLDARLAHLDQESAVLALAGAVGPNPATILSPQVGIEAAAEFAR
jgi:hypothetical protein